MHVHVWCHVITCRVWCGRGCLVVVCAIITSIYINTLAPIATAMHSFRALIYICNKLMLFLAILQQFVTKMILLEQVRSWLTVLSVLKPSAQWHEHSVSLESLEHVAGKIILLPFSCTVHEVLNSGNFSYILLKPFCIIAVKWQLAPIGRLRPTMCHRHSLGVKNVSPGIRSPSKQMSWDSCN